MSSARSLHTATELANGHVLIAGGYDRTLATLASAEIYDPITGLFTPTGSMGAARVAAEATQLRNGKILMVGDKMPAAMPSPQWSCLTRSREPSHRLVRCSRLGSTQQSPCSAMDECLWLGAMKAQAMAPPRYC